MIAKRIIGLLLFLGFVCGLQAQRPKMHLKARVGTHGLNYVYKTEIKSNEFFAGINGGFSFRVLQKKKMGEIGFDFLRSYITYSEGDSLDFSLKLNSFELPITIGYVTRNKPVFKHFLYGGIVTHFNVKSFVFLTDNPDESIKIKPNEIGFLNPTFAMRFGTQIDVAMFNFELNYSIGLNKAFRGSVRTQTHNVQFNVGLVF